MTSVPRAIGRCIAWYCCLHKTGLVVCQCYQFELQSMTLSLKLSVSWPQAGTESPCNPIPGCKVIAGSGQVTVPNPSGVFVLQLYNEPTTWTSDQPTCAVFFASNLTPNLTAVAPTSLTSATSLSVTASGFSGQDGKISVTVAGEGRQACLSPCTRHVKVCHLCAYVPGSASLCL